jgi:hypothetical protein
MKNVYYIEKRNVQIIKEKKGGGRRKRRVFRGKIN